MENSKSCSCKGIRKCFFCDENFNNRTDPLAGLKQFVYCADCGNKAFASGFIETHQQSGHVDPENPEEMITIDGVFLQLDALTEDDELELLQSCQSNDWVDSQSGRRKQDFGPKVNFKKQKVNFEPFHGLPTRDMKVLERVKNRLKRCEDWTRFASITNDVEDDQNESVLHNFQTVEICHLEYCPERGSSIDPHFDDFWIWGERLVTFNLLSTTILSLTTPDLPSYLIQIICPARSILVLYGDARHRYHHSIRRCDITSRRLAVTYRELPAKFMNHSTEEFAKFGRRFLEKAQVRL